MNNDLQDYEDYANYRKQKIIAEQKSDDGFKEVMRIELPEGMTADDFKNDSCSHAVTTVVCLK